MTNSQRCIFHHLWRDRCCCSVSHVTMPVIDCSCSWGREHGFWILWSDLKLLTWNPKITFASYTCWIWTVVHILTGSLKTLRGLCNIFFFVWTCWTLKKKLSQTRQIEGDPSSTLTFSIVLGRTYLDDSVLEAPIFFWSTMGMGCYVGWMQKTMGHTHKQKNRMATDVFCVYDSPPVRWGLLDFMSVSSPPPPSPSSPPPRLPSPCPVAILCVQCGMSDLNCDPVSSV